MTLSSTPALMTDELFREDAQLTRCEARITAVSDAGIELDRTVFYPHGGGQAGDAGVLRLADGRVMAISDTRKGAAPRQRPSPAQSSAIS